MQVGCRAAAGMTPDGGGLLHRTPLLSATACANEAHEDLLGCRGGACLQRRVEGANVFVRQRRLRKACEQRSSSELRVRVAPTICKSQCFSHLYVQLELEVHVEGYSIVSRI